MTRIDDENQGGHLNKRGSAMLRPDRWPGIRTFALAAVFLALNIPVSLEANNLTDLAAQTGLIDRLAVSYSVWIADAYQNETPSPAQNDSLFARLFGPQRSLSEGPESWPMRVGRALVSFVIAALLAAVLAFRPRNLDKIFFHLIRRTSTAFSGSRKKAVLIAINKRRKDE